MRTDHKPLAKETMPLLWNSRSFQTADQAALDETAREERQIRRVAFGGFLLNLSLAGVKGCLAQLSGSLALAADALDSAADSVASLLVWFGLNLSTRKPRSFPYGLYKIENVVSVAVAVLIFLAGIKIAHQALQPPGGSLLITIPVIAAAQAALVLSILFGRYATRVGRRTNSPTMVAEGKHRQVDALSSAVVLGSLVSNYFGHNVDRIAAMVVLIFILYAGWELLSGGIRVLLDASLDRKTIQQIETIILSHPQVETIEFLVGRSAGRYRFVETNLTLRMTDLKKAHQISQEIEGAIREQVPHLERVLIHYQPSRSIHLRVAAPLADMQGAISDHFGEAPYFVFAVLRTDANEIEGQEILANSFADLPKAKGMRVAEWLLERGVDLVMVRGPLKGKGPGYALSDAGVEVRLTDLANFYDALQALGREALPPTGTGRE